MINEWNERMIYKELLERLSQLNDTQLNTTVIALIDGEPWDCDRFEISDPNDDWKPNQPYFVYE